MADKSERDQAWDFAEKVLKAAYPNATLKGFVPEGRDETPLNVSPAQEYVFRADFGDGDTCHVTAQRSTAGGWLVCVPHQAPVGPRVLP